MKIGLVGLGFVGNAIDNCLSKQTELFTILKYDKYKNGGIGKIEDILYCDMIFLCLPTLYSDELKKYDTSALVETLSYLNEKQYTGIILIKSTVEPLFCNNINNKYPILKICHNPEFLTSRTANEDFINQTHIVIGLTEKSNIIQTQEFIRNFYSKLFPSVKLSICSSTESETMKIAANSFYAVKIQYFNEIYDLCQKINIKYDIVKNLIVENGWVNSQHTSIPGPDGKLSYGGACFPKDTTALLEFMKSNNILCGVLESTINERNKLRVE